MDRLLGLLGRFFPKQSLTVGDLTVLLSKGVWQVPPDVDAAREHSLYCNLQYLCDTYPYKYIDSKINMLMNFLHLFLGL